MLAKAILVAILPAVDLNRAKKFYTEKIGLRVSEESPKGLVFKSAKLLPEFVKALPRVINTKRFNFLVFRGSEIMSTILNRGFSEASGS